MRIPIISRLSTLCAICALVLATACGQEPERREDRAWVAHQAALTTANGLSTNGLSTNGLSTNGLSTNGLSTNGLSTNGFNTWFLANPASYSDMVMKYVVRCALAAGRSLSYSSGGVTYTWPGELGLAPTWAGGSAAPVSEQQLVSACLGAHVNKYGVQMGISVRGYYTNGTYITVTDAENALYAAEEGCFFGNLFDGTGVFSAYGANSLLTLLTNTSERACAISGGVVGSCAPMVATGKTCQQICSGNANYITGYFEFTGCTWNGKTYRPISTRLTFAQIFTTP